MTPRSSQTKQTPTSEKSIFFFAVSIAALAVFFCVLVSVLLIRAAKPSGAPVVSTPQVNGTTDAPAEPSAPSVPIFSPSVSVLPHSTEQTKELTGELFSEFGVLVDAETGEILASKGANERIQPASMTKIMTLLVACQRLSEWDLSQNSTLTQEIHDYVRPTAGGYKGASCHWPDVGDGATVLDQLYGIGVESSADCSVMIACYIVGKSPAESEAQFVQWMNEEATAMGLTGTHFDNIIGYESDQNYSTPSDIAAILIRALESPLIAEILGTSERAFTAYGYSSTGNFVHYDSYYYSTLFNANSKRASREKAYEEKYGTFTLTNVTLKGGKTGSLEEGSGWNYSLASFATSPSGKTYVCITANVTVGSAVLKDAKTLYDGITP